MNLLKFLTKGLDLKLIIGLNLNKLAHLSFVLLLPKVSFGFSLDGMLSGLIKLVLKLLVVDHNITHSTFQIIGLIAYDSLDFKFPPQCI